MTNGSEDYDDWLDWLNLYETAYFVINHAEFMEHHESFQSFEKFLEYYAVLWKNK